MDKDPLDAVISFRVARKMVDDIEAYQRLRRLPQKSDAARELMAAATLESALLQAANEARALNLDPVATLRERIATAT